MSNHHTPDNDLEERRMNPAESERLARGQKLLIAALVANYVGLKLALDAPPLMVLVGVVALGLFIAAMVDIGKGFRWSSPAIALCLVVMIIPLVNLIALLWLNGKVTRALRAAGYHVGFFGASRLPGAEP